MTRLALYLLLALAVGVAVRPSPAGAVAVASVAVVVAVLRRQDSLDEQGVRDDRWKASSADLTDLRKDHAALREEFDRVKLMVPRPRA